MYRCSLGSRPSTLPSALSSSSSHSADLQRLQGHKEKLSCGPHRPLCGLLPSAPFRKLANKSQIDQWVPSFLTSGLAFCTCSNKWQGLIPIMNPLFSHLIVTLLPWMISGFWMGSVNGEQLRPEEGRVHQGVHSLGFPLCYWVTQDHPTYSHSSRGSASPQNSSMFYFLQLSCRSWDGQIFIYSPGALYHSCWLPFTLPTLCKYSLQQILLNFKGAYWPKWKGWKYKTHKSQPLWLWVRWWLLRGDNRSATGLQNVRYLCFKRHH